LASGALTVVHYRHYRNYSRQTVYLDEDYGPPHPPGYGPYEYRELQRQFPSTNWPLGLRYYER
jgi:hypothetical protein